MCHYVRVACHGLGFTTFHDHDDGDGIRICFIYFAVVLFPVLGHFSGCLSSALPPLSTCIIMYICNNPNLLVFCCS